MTSAVRRSVVPPARSPARPIASQADGRQDPVAVSVLVDALAITLASVAALLGSDIVMTRRFLGWLGLFDLMTFASLTRLRSYRRGTTASLVDELARLLGVTGTVGVMVIVLRLMLAPGPDVGGQGLRMWAFVTLFLAAARIALSSRELLHRKPESSARPYERLSAWRPRTPRRDHRTFLKTRHVRVAWLVAGCWVLFCVAQLALAYGNAARGMREGGLAQRAIESGGFDGGQAQVRMDEARRSFHRAYRRSSSPVLAPLRLVPILGRQLSSFTDLADAAARVAGVASATAEAVGDVPGRARPTGPDRVAMLRVLADRAASADIALGRVRLGARGGLVEPLRRRRAVLERHVASTRATVRTAAEGLTGVASVLEGPRRYLLLAANNAEMRAGSGMFLSIGTIETARGSVKVGQLQPAGELTLPGAGVSVEGDLAARWNWLAPGREWRNLATTPRFDATAPLAARMWQSLTGEQVDGVLAVDVPFLAAIIGATGPVAAGDDVVSETTALDRLLRDQYQGLDVHDVQAPRREKLGAIAAGVVEALERGDYSPRRLMTGLAHTTRGRHLLAWSSLPGDQRTWEKTGVAGSLQPTSLAVNVLNRGGNKLDPFLDVDAEVGLRPGSGSTEVNVRLKVANHAPDGLSPYIAGPYPGSGVGEGDYLGIVAVNLPGAASDVALDGASKVVTSGVDGPTQVVAVSLLLARGQETTVTVQFRLPSSLTSMEVVPSARVPAVRWQAGRDRWEDGAPKVVSWRWE